MNNPQKFHLRRQSLDITIAPRPLASGADGAIHQVLSHTTADAMKFVVKLYHDPGRDPTRSGKLEAMLDHPPGRVNTTENGKLYVELAWPVDIVDTPQGDFAGYLMPLVDFKHSTSLENLISAKARRAHKIPDSYQNQLIVAGNLTSVMTELHAQGHYIIDLKPININVYLDTWYLAILDCDGFSIRGNKQQYPGHQFSNGYVCPEALQQNLRPEDLGEQQDRFAMAVILFQLMNRGIHPYQGSPRKGHRVPPSNDERVAQELYAYGKRRNDKLDASVWSLHSYFEDDTRELFDRAFTEPDNRPSAEEWRNHFRWLLMGDEPRLVQCSRNPEHVHFSDGCGLCALQDQARKLQEANTAAQAKARRQQGTGGSAATTGKAGLFSVRLVSIIKNIFSQNPLKWLFGKLLKPAVIIPVVVLAGLLIYLYFGLRSNLNDETRVLVAIENNQPASLTRHLNNKLSARTKDRSMVTALHRAAYLDREHMLELLLKNGARISATDKQGRDAIQHAADGRAYKTLRALHRHYLRLGQRQQLRIRLQQAIRRQKTKRRRYNPGYPDPVLRELNRLLKTISDARFRTSIRLGTRAGLRFPRLIPGSRFYLASDKLDILQLDRYLDDVVKKYRVGHNIRGLTVSPDGKWFATYRYDRSALVIYSRALHRSHRHHRRFVIDLYNIKTGKHKARINIPDEIDAMRFTPDNNWLAIASRGRDILLWKLADLVRGNTLNHNPKPSRSIPTSRLLAGSSSRSGSSNVIQAMAFDPKHTRIALSLRRHPYTVIYTPESNKILQLNRQFRTASLAFSNDGRQLVTTGLYKPVIYLWDTDNGRLKKYFLTNQRRSIRTARFINNDRQVLVVYSGRYDPALRKSPAELLIWDITTGLKLHEHEFADAASAEVSRDHHTVMTSSRGGQVRFIKLQKLAQNKP